MDDELDISLGGLPSYLQDSVRRSFYNSRHRLGIRIDNRLKDEKFDDELSDIVYCIKQKRLLLDKIIDNGIYIRYCSPRQEKDERIVLLALSSNPLVLFYLSSSYKDREDIIFPLLKEYPEVYQFVSPRLKKEKNFVLKAVEVNGLVLEYVSSNLKSDYDVVLKAVSNNGMSLKYADNMMQANRDIILTAVLNNGLAIRYANPDIWMKDKEIILSTLKTVGARQFIYDIDYKLKDDVEFMLECSKIDPKILFLATERVKDIIRINYIKRYVDNYLDSGFLYSHLQSTDKSLSVSTELDNNYHEYEEEKNKFIKFVSRYKMNSIDNDDLIYQILLEKIEYEITLSIGGFVSSINDYQYQYELFLNKIYGVYNFIIKLVCSKDNTPSNYYDKLLDCNLLPDDFYRQLIELKNKREEEKQRYIQTIREYKNKFIVKYQVNDYHVKKGIDKVLDKYLKKVDELSTYDIDKLKEDLEKDLDKVKGILKVVSRVQELWNKRDLLDIKSIPIKEYQKISYKLSWEVVCDDYFELGLDEYLKQLDEIERIIDNRLLLMSKHYDISSYGDFYIKEVDQYCDSLLELFKDNNIMFVKNMEKSDLRILHDELLEFYGKYYEGLSEDKLSLISIKTMKGDLLNNNYNILVQDMINKSSSSINNGESIILVNIVFRDLIDKYRKQLKKVDSKEEIRKLQSKFDDLFLIYLDICKGQCDYYDILEKINYLKNYSFKENSKTKYDSNVDEVFVEVNDSEHSFMKINYTMGESDDSYEYMLGSSHKTENNNDLVSIEDFIKDMVYVGKWDLSPLGIRHIIYANSEYCIAMQSTIFSDDELEVIKIDDLGDRLHDYSEDIVEVYQRFRDKEVFLKELRHILEKSYNEAVGITQKKYIYGD